MISTLLPHRKLYFWVLGLSLLAALVPVIWPSADIAVAAYFLRPPPSWHPADWLWVTWVNEYLPDTFRTIGFACLFGWAGLALARRYRKAAMVLSFVGLALLLGPGFSSWAVKEHTLRARPFDVTEFGGDRTFTPALEQANQCTDNCAFISGHVACGFFLVSLMLIDPRRRYLWLAAGLLAGALVALARMSVGAHWLSDALWALPITLACSGLVRFFVGWLYGPHDVRHGVWQHLKLLRPHQWLKNVFVFAGLMFSHRWNDGTVLGQVVLATLAFCATSSLVYLVNDWRDRESDAQHPTKRMRPLASGAVAPRTAFWMGVALAALALMLAGMHGVLLVLLGIYVLMNLAYSWRLKHVPVVDVSIIASGFILRLLAGTSAVGIPPSRWLLLTGLFVALFLGFSKRKAETFHAPQQQRAVMEHYPPALLDTYIAAMMTATILTYGLYATSAEALQQHGGRLVYTVPIVVFALLRYTYQVQRGRGEDVSSDMMRDPWIVASGLAWLAVFFATQLWR